MYSHIYLSPLGDIALTAKNEGLTALSFLAGARPLIIPDSYQKNVKLFLHVIEQLDQYFYENRTQFDLPLAPKGTPFQQSVWHTLTTIKQGETQSYGWLAEKIDNPKAVRAVGRANGANPIALIIPCHRVIGKNGNLTGYAGGVALKKEILRFEGAKFNT